MKTLITLSLLTLAALALGKEIPLTIGYLITLTGTHTSQAAREHREQWKKDCPTGCSIMRVESNGRLLAEMDNDGQWHEYAPRPEIADAMLFALKR